MSGLLSTMIYCVTTHFPFFLLLSLYFLFFYHEEIYLSKEKQCYLFVMLPCKYAVSPLQAVNCIPWAVQICLFSIKSLSQMFMSHIR